MIGLDSYDSPQKQSHRGWALNRIIERLPRHEREASVLYLVGPDDVDGQLFVKRGFREVNLTAVDCKPECIRSARNGGRLAIQGDVLTILANWNATPIDVLHLDTCSTWNVSLKMLMTAYSSGAINGNSVVYLNMQMGREKHFETEWVQNCRQDIGGHRGKWVIATLFSVFTSRLIRENGLQCWPDAARAMWIDEWRKVWEDHCRPEFGDYKGSSVPMHSIVMRCPQLRLQIASPPERPRVKKTICRRLAALKAHRTRRRSIA